MEEAAPLFQHGSIEVEDGKLRTKRAMKFGAEGDVRAEMHLQAMQASQVSSAANNNGGKAHMKGLPPAKVSEPPPQSGDGLDVATHLHVYAPAAWTLYEELDASQRQLEAEIGSAISAALAQPNATNEDAAAAAAPFAVLALRWDTSVLDIEEDRVIWVRESDLGQAVREGENEINLLS